MPHYRQERNELIDLTHALEVKLQDWKDAPQPPEHWDSGILCTREEVTALLEVCALADKIRAKLGEVGAGPA